MRHSLRHRRIDRVLADIPLHPEVIRACTFIFGQCASLHFILVGRVPGADDDFAASTHGLRVGGHHADGAEVVEDVLCGDGLGADARFGKGDVFGDVAR